MTAHKELIERLRCFDRVSCNEAADALESQALEMEGLRLKVVTVIERLDWLATCSDSEMGDGDTARRVACELIALLGGPPPEDF